MNPGTKKRSSRNKYLKGKPVLLNSWSKDYNTLGIFCQKTNLVEYARDCLKCLRSDTEESRLFFRGVSAADEWGFDAIAFEIKQIRILTGSRFDSFIYEQAGFSVLTELKKAVGDARDWETEDQVRQGLEFVNLKNQPKHEVVV